jgi:hypothetical protein
MTTKLEVFKAELEALETADRYDAPEYDYLAEMVDKLSAEERAGAAAPAATTTATAQPEAQSVAALLADMEAAARNPDRYSDEHVQGLVARYNAAVVEAGERAEQAGPLDMQALLRDMVRAGADPDALSDAERAELMARYNQATRQGPESRSVASLRSDLAAGDLLVRMAAAGELDRRGEPLDDATVEAMLGEYNAEVFAANERGPNVAELPEELRPAAEALLKAAADLEVPPDPVDAALKEWNEALLAMKPPTLEEQLADLGIEPASITTSQEG